METMGILSKITTCESLKTKPGRNPLHVKTFSQITAPLFFAAGTHAMAPRAGAAEVSGLIIPSDNSGM